MILRYPEPGLPESMPETLRRDSLVRTGMEWALTQNTEAIAEVNACIVNLQLQPLASVAVTYPFCMPDAAACTVGTNNDELKKFAFRAYDKLTSYFAGQDWEGWLVLPYIAEGDETGGSFHIGVFVDDSFQVEE